MTPHFGVKATSAGGSNVKVFEYETKDNVINRQTSDTMKQILEKVVSEGGGKNAAIDGFCIGGKTATSQKLPRGNGKYIASFVGFAPADNPSAKSCFLKKYSESLNLICALYELVLYIITSPNPSRNIIMNSRL